MLQHKHISVNALIDSPLQSENEATAFLENLLENVDTKPVGGPFARYVNKPDNRGLAAIVMIETGHAVFRIWDEKDPATLRLDLYTSDALDVGLVLQTIKDKFDVGSMDYRLYDREKSFVLEKEETYNREEPSDG